MGQRLDRPATSAANTGVQSQGGQAGATVPTSLSTTFSSSSASSTSSSSSNTSGAVAHAANGASAATNSQNSTSRNSNSRHNHRHRRHNHRSRASESDAQTTVANAENADMSPRTRFRHEMARRGYTNNSSDLFVRLFQFPSQQGSQTSSNAANPPDTTASESTSTTLTPSTATGSRGTSSGLSAFRFFNLGGGNSSAQNTGDLDSDLSSDEDELHWNHNLNSLAQSLPFFFGVRDFKCFVCNKQIPADDAEAHIMMCLTKPRLTYNEDVLTDDKGECIICFEELEKGQTIARLQCLCIYHKHCIDDWLTRSQSCPGHPPD